MCICGINLVQNANLPGLCGIERLCRRNTDRADLPLCGPWPRGGRVGADAGPLSQRQPPECGGLPDVCREAHGAGRTPAETAHGLLHLRQYRQNQFCPQHRHGVYRRSRHEHAGQHDELSAVLPGSAGVYVLSELAAGPDRGPCDHPGVAGFQRDEQSFPAGSRWPSGAERTADGRGAVLCRGHRGHQEL